MIFYIKEWPDDTVTLMTEGGRVLWTFASVEEAEAAAQDSDRAPMTADGVDVGAFRARLDRRDAGGDFSGSAMRIVHGGK